MHIGICKAPYGYSFSNNKGQITKDTDNQTLLPIRGINFKAYNYALIMKAKYVIHATNGLNPSLTDKHSAQCSPWTTGNGHFTAKQAAGTKQNVNMCTFILSANFFALDIF